MDCFSALRSVEASSLKAISDHKCKEILYLGVRQFLCRFILVFVSVSNKFFFVPAPTSNVLSLLVNPFEAPPQHPKTYRVYQRAIAVRYKTIRTLFVSLFHSATLMTDFSSTKTLPTSSAVGCQP